MVVKNELSNAIHPLIPSFSLAYYSISQDSRFPYLPTSLRHTNSRISPRPSLHTYFSVFCVVDREVKKTTLLLLLLLLTTPRVQKASRLGARGPLQATLHHRQVLPGIHHEHPGPAEGQGTDDGQKKRKKKIEGIWTLVRSRCFFANSRSSPHIYVDGCW